MAAPTTAGELAHGPDVNGGTTRTGIITGVGYPSALYAQCEYLDPATKERKFCYVLLSAWTLIT